MGTTGVDIYTQVTQNVNIKFFLDGKEIRLIVGDTNFNFLTGDQTSISMYKRSLEDVLFFGFGDVDTPILFQIKVQ